MRLISRNEELLLLAIWKLQDNAYGVTIRDQVTKMTKKYWSIGAIYDVLDRLDRSGYVITTSSEPVPERGGKRKRLFKITRDGFAALEEVKTLQNTIWADLPGLAYE